MSQADAEKARPLPKTMALPDRMKGQTLLLVLCFLSFTAITTDAVRLYHFCTTTTPYTPNSAFRSNLNTLLTALSAAANTTVAGFYNSTAGNSSSDKVYGLYLCRGDASPKACRDCVANTTQDLVKSCPTQREAIVWYDDCMLRYSNQSVFSNPSDASFANAKDIDSSIKTEFNQVVLQTLAAVANQAARNQSGMKFATKEANFSGNRPLYTLAQCTPDLPISACNSCLADAISTISSCCLGKQGSRDLRSSCNIRYEIYPFYYLNATASPPPAPSPAPPPNNSGYMTSNFEMSEASINSSSSHQTIVCNHGVSVSSYTSWTKRNPGRKFLRCRFWKDDDCKWFQWIDDERTAREKVLCGVLLDKGRVLQEQVKVFEKENLRKKEKLLKFQKERKCIIEENIKLKRKLQEYNKFVRGMIVLGLLCFLLSLWVMKHEGSKFKYLALM